MSDALREFLPRLLEGTVAGQVTWRPDDSGGFTARTDHGAISVTQEGDPGPKTTLRLRSVRGETLDEIATDPTNPGPWLRWEEMLMALYQAAEGDAKGTRRVLDTLARDWNLARDDDDVSL